MKIANTVLAIAAVGFIGGLHADDGSLFKSKCGMCHKATIQGKATGTGSSGPDLTGINGKRTEEYLKLYIINPNEARTKHADIYNKEIKNKYSMKMPAVKLNDEQLKTIVSSLK